jgi:hypothetical protein
MTDWEPCKFVYSDAVLLSQAEARIAELEAEVARLHACLAERDKMNLEFQAEVARLRGFLIAERLENLWHAYNTGLERDGMWTHAFISDGEWLAREVGLDPALGWYDIDDVKIRIPKAAARAALSPKEG